jgi:hypothetical protein
MAPAQYDQAAKSFAPPSPDRAHVYIYRNESMGAAVKMDLKLDGAPVGTTVAKSFALLPVRPGQHQLASEAENTSELPFVARPGEVISVWQEVKMGFLYARNKLQIVSPNVGRAGVSECNLIAYPPPPLPLLPPPPATAPAPPVLPATSAPPTPPTS